MGENAQKIGKKLEQLGVDLLGMFKWNKKMSDKEIKCTRSTHKNAEGKPKQTHGIDLYMEYKDPYIGSVQGVFIECKNRVWSKINQKEIERFDICFWTETKEENDYINENFLSSNIFRKSRNLKNSQSGVSIILFSDNVGNNKLHNIEFTDFCKEYPNVKISMQKTGEIFHDRFIVLDYGTADERVFLCGASSKDAGARITSIVEDYGTKKYASVMATLLQNPPLVLPK